ncbi:MAG TPA: response regulator transcription factor [Chitinophagales bacterium]|nr:response regulator transcription factor [Chitinophagales bacterium]HLP52578.1 response regulator transcription factor [Chitinophagales bacterium]
MSKGKTILLVEDEEAIAYALKLNLEAEDYTVHLCETGGKAITFLQHHHADLLLLDVMLPEADGYQICMHFREKDKYTPVVFISAKNDHQSRMHGLRVGADDYINKPFNLDELMLKINRLLFKNDLRKDHDIVYFGDCWIDFTTLEAKGVNGTKVNMSKLEFDLAKLLITNKDKPLSRAFLYSKLWGYDKKHQPNSRTLDNFMVFIRRYFEKDISNPEYFVSVRGVGYKFVG